MMKSLTNYLYLKQRLYSLESLYMMKSLTNHLYLKQRLYSFWLGSKRSIEDYIDDFHKLIHDLENIEVKVKDDDQARTHHVKFFARLIRTLGGYAFIRARLIIAYGGTSSINVQGAQEKEARRERFFIRGRLV